MSAARILLLLALLAGCAATARWQAPTEQQMAAVKEGMSRAEVEKIMVNPPDGGTERNREGEMVSAWRLRPEGDTAAVYFQVHYRNSRVMRTTRGRFYEPTL